MTPLPKTEPDAFLLAVTEAGDLGSTGDVFAGYHCLLGGIERAEELEENSVPSAAELVARHRRARDVYGVAWGLRIE